MTNGGELFHIRDLEGNEEALTGFKSLIRKRKVNSERTIDFTIVPNDNNEYSFPLIKEESVMTFDGEEYVIKQLSSNGRFKKGTAIHKFYVDLVNKQQPKIHNGSITFRRFMEEYVFEGTGIEVVVTGTFPARSFENMGNDNRLALLSLGIDRFKAEFELVGNQARFKHEIGVDSDFQFRYGHNIKAIDTNTDTTNLSTIIHGKWEDGMELTYRSDNADYFGELDAPFFTNENYTSRETRLQAMEDRLQDTPEFSITIDFADLRAVGYPFLVPNEGDRVFVIYEPMDDLLIETRILGIEEMYDENLNVIGTTVTLANFRKTLAEAMFENTQKQLSNIVNEDGVIRYSVLDEAVKLATEALQSAQTELEFNNGIVAREKTDPNKMVVLNSAGLGISDDSGQTFRTAITGDGIVADYITTGTLRSIIVDSVEIYGSYIEGSTIVSKNNDDDYIKLEGSTLYSHGLHDRTWFGETGTDQVQIGFDNGQLRARNHTQEWSLYFNDYGISTFSDGDGTGYPGGNASGAIEFHSYRYSHGQFRGMTLMSYGRIGIESSNENGARIYLNPNGASVRVSDVEDNYYNVAAAGFNQSSRHTQKRDIKDLTDDALSLIRSLDIKEYKRLTNGEETIEDQWQAGLIVEDSPYQLLADGDTIDIYTYVNYITRALQQICDVLESEYDMEVS